MHIKDGIKEVTCPISELEDTIPTKCITSVNISDLSKIFEYEDPYLQYFLLTKNESQNFSINKKITHKVIKMINNLKRFTIVKYNHLDLNSTILKWIKIHTKNFEDSSDIISILQVCKPSDDDKTFFRKFFGYNLIYKEYKKLINEESTLNLDIILVLLDNNKICHNRLLEVYKKLNFYLENNILDKNFIFCCKVLYSLLDYEFQESYRDFLLGFSIYLIDLIYMPDTVKIFELTDMELIIKLVKLIYPIGSEKYKTGVFVKCMDRSINIFTNIFEDTITLIFTLELIDITDNSFVVTETVELLHDNLENFIISPLFKNYKDYDFIITRYLEYKYKVLDKLKLKMNRNYDKIKIYNDLFNNDEYNELILSSSSLLSLDFIIDNLIILINNSKNKIQFINILFEKTGIENISYLYLYLLALKDNYKHVLYFTVYFINIDNHSRKYFEMLIMIYFKFIEIDDVYIDKSRIQIIKYITCNEIYMDIIIKETKKYGKYNKNTFILLYFVINTIEEVRKEDFEFLYTFLIEEIKEIKQKSKKVNINIDTVNINVNTFKYETDVRNYNLKKLYMKVCLNLLTKCKEDKKIEMIKSKDFYNLVVMLSYLKKKNGNIEVIKEDIFEYVFLCSNKKRKRLYKIIFKDKHVIK